MLNFHENVYLSEALKQSRYAEISANSANAILLAPGSKDTGAFFASMHHYMSHIANISKIFWPTSNRPRAKRRGNYLRNSLTLSNTHPLSKMALRNHLEHFDDRLDEWAENNKRSWIADEIVGAPSMLGSFDSSEIFRLFDPNTSSFIFRGEVYNIQDIEDGRSDITRRIIDRLKHLRVHQQDHTS